MKSLGQLITAFVLMAAIVTAAPEWWSTAAEADEAIVMDYSCGSVQSYTPYRSGGYVRAEGEINCSYADNRGITSYLYYGNPDGADPVVASTYYEDSDTYYWVRSNRAVTDCGRNFGYYSRSSVYDSVRGTSYSNFSAQYVSHYGHAC